VVQIAMHSADQFDAWRVLIDKGASVPEIAARFGVAKSTVKKRLAPACVSPLIFALYRMALSALKFCGLSPSRTTMPCRRAYGRACPEWQRNDARAIREALTETDVPSHDRRVRFVGLEAYEAAGGIVRRDLFDAEWRICAGCGLARQAHAPEA
jgi:ParB family transcriptional regulator, chromosome partitioning protein